MDGKYVGTSLGKSETEGELDGFSDGMLVGKSDKVGELDGN